MEYLPKVKKKMTENPRYVAVHRGRYSRWIEASDAKEVEERMYRMGGVRASVSSHSHDPSEAKPVNCD